MTTFVCQARGCNAEADTAYVDNLRPLVAGVHVQVRSCRPHIEQWGDGKANDFVIR